MIPDNLVGGNFVLFSGVVEDICDPEEMGRVKVRCFGYHSANKTDIPTSALPWSTPMTPIYSASMSGIGTTPTGILPGSWVIGFFRDGPSAQDPIILGTIPSRSSSANPREGFSDPAGIHPRSPGEVDTSKCGRAAFREHRAYTQKVDTLIEKVETAAPAELTSVSVPEPEAYYMRKTWSVPAPSTYINPKYPFNSVTETLNGHVSERDDTPGYKRLSETHSSGTYHVITNDGSEIHTILSSRYTAILGTDSIYIKGACNITVDGDCRQLIKGNYHLEVGGNYTETITGSRQTKIGLSEQTEIGQDKAENIGGNAVQLIGGTENRTIQDDASIVYSKDSSVTVTGDLSDMIMGSRNSVTGSNSVCAVGGNSTDVVLGTLTISAASISIHGAGGIGVSSSGSPATSTSGISIVADGSCVIDAADISATAGSVTLDTSLLSVSGAVEAASFTVV